jgi:hypothetical protein
MKTERIITKRNDKGHILEYKWLVDGKEIPEGKRYCPGCQTILELSCFSTHGKKCKQCANKAARESYSKRANPEFLAQQRKKQREDGKYKKLRAINHMGGKCYDCGGIFPSQVYDFHHLDPSVKEHNIGDIVRRKSFETIEKELTKCVLLCANCHRIRHFEGGDYEI